MEIANRMNFSNPIDIEPIRYQSKKGKKNDKAVLFYVRYEEGLLVLDSKKRELY